MTGRKTLQEVRKQLAAARATVLPATDTAAAQEAIAALERLAVELDPAKDGRTESEPLSPEVAGQTKRRT